MAMSDREYQALQEQRTMNTRVEPLFDEFAEGYARGRAEAYAEVIQAVKAARDGAASTGTRKAMVELLRELQASRKAEGKGKVKP